MNRNVLKQNFTDFVQKKFQFLNSVFLGLPLEKDNRSTGKILVEFNEYVQRGIDQGRSPEDIISGFFNDNEDEENVISSLFQIIKYIEREVVLFDAVEDASFEKINNLSGPNSLESVIGNALANDRGGDLMESISGNNIRLVLTAHPTQFYPGTILGIINDLNTAIRGNDLTRISSILEQLAFTPFFNKRKPTPYDEAVSLIWYLENVFYDAILNIQESVQNSLPDYTGESINTSLVEMGFWPGGDRDGNPFVTAEITLRVANRLRSSILNKYYEEVRALKRKLTFRGVHEKLRSIEFALLKSIYSEGRPDFSADELLSGLREICGIVKENYNSIYLRDVEKLITTVSIFRYHFASLDIRQDSSIHRGVVKEILTGFSRYEEYSALDDDKKSFFLKEAALPGMEYSGDSEEVRETLQCIRTIREIQLLNGEKGCNRYIISNCGSETDIPELLFLFEYAGWKRDEVTVDFIPLFETIKDLESAALIMRRLYANPVYSGHLKRRGNRQTVMLGFSDGTKDGGYFTANWSIYKAKEALTAVSAEAGIELTFFDGRGGPAARGGGKTHNYYTAHGKSIENRRIHLTVQGQTVSSNFGTVMSARYNMEQLVSASLKNRLYSRYNEDFLPESRALMEKISSASYSAYMKLRSNEKFIPYLANRSAMPYYGMANIGSRPDKRKSPGTLTLKDLRAIPFVGAWNLNKQNVPGFYGMGHALEIIIREGGLSDLQKLYNVSLFFRTLVQNSMMVLKKTNFRLTSYMKEDREYGDLWLELLDEYNLACKNLLTVSGFEYLMEGNPKDLYSVELRENMILPLCVIQQYALCMTNRLKSSDDETDSPFLEKYIRMIIRASYGIINAGRNSA